MKISKVALLWGLISFSLLILLIAPFIGLQKITLFDIFSNLGDQTKIDIFWKIRLPRALTAFLAGAALSISGMTFQAMFRNALATPFTLGVSSGAAFGAAIYVKLGLLFTLLGFSGQVLFAFAGAFLSVVLVFGISRLKKGFTTASMLIAGVAINFFFSSLILFIQYLSDFSRSFQIIRWLMGGFEMVGFKPVLIIMPITLLGTAVIIFLTHELNLISLGDDVAISRGSNIAKLRLVLFFAVSLMVGAVVSICGPIGFIGMMAPHICRLIVGYNHRYLAPVTFFFGGAFLLVCDILARTLISPAEIPVGVITALLGGPFFLYLLIRSREHEVIF